jgi:glycosyltransferase involved in cell wall biosynthesis
VLISVVIPARNEERYLAACLGSIRGQPFGRAVELIVVDHESRDATPKIAASFGARVLRTDGTIGALRQAGVDAARGDVIASTDADTLVGRRWLGTIRRRFLRDPQLVALHGPLGYAGMASPSARILARAGWEAFRWAHEAVGFTVMSAANFAVRREALLAIGGFDTQLASAEDLDLARRLAREGRIAYDVRMAVYTSPRRLESQGYARFVQHQLRNYVKYYRRRDPLPLERVD